MKIGLLNNLYEPYGRGGAEIVVQKTAVVLKTSGQEIFLISTRPKRKKKIDQEKQTGENHGFPIYYLDSNFYHLATYSASWRLIWQIGNLLNFKKYWQIKKILVAEKPDLVVTHNLMGLGFLIPSLLKKLGIRHQHFLHDIQLLHPSGLLLYGQEKKIASVGACLYQTATRRLFATPEKIISPSRWLLAEHVRRDFFKKSLQEVKPFNWSSANDEIKGASAKKDAQAALAANIPTSLDEVEKSESERTDINRQNKKTFLFVGQIEDHKGIFFLIKTFKKLTALEASLLIVGDGHKLEAAKQTAAGDERIKFLGRVALGELKNLLKQVDCLIVPSLCYENSPTIIHEARAAGCPIIAARIGGIPEIVNDPEQLFTPGAEEELLEKIKRF